MSRQLYYQSTAVKNRLKVLRAENDWSQGRLAVELGVSRQTVNAIETGKYDPSLTLAFDLARVFSTPIEAIFFPEPSQPKKERQPDRDHSAAQLPFPELDVSLM
jgi:putative transcriptional regulator